jgi:hypothetical protein
MAIQFIAIEARAACLGLVFELEKQLQGQSGERL